MLLQIGAPDFELRSSSGGGPFQAVGATRASRGQCCQEKEKDTWYVLSPKFEGNTITFAVDGQVIDTYTDDGTAHGPLLSNGLVGFIDDRAS